MKCRSVITSISVLYCSLILSLAATGLNAAEETLPDSASVVDRVKQLLDNAATDGFSGAVLLEQNGEVTLEAAYGLANPAEEIPFTIATIHQIGSISKQFTATAAAKLASENLLDLHIPLDNYLEGHSYLSEITLHDLLTHTAGLPDNCGADFAYRSRDELLDDCLAGMQSEDKTDEVVYSNLGYSLIAAVIEVVSNQLFADYVRNELLQPLNLNDTDYFFGSRDLTMFAYGKLSGEPQQPNIAYNLEELEGRHWNLMGNGGMQSTIADMRIWQMALMSNNFLNPKVAELVLTPHVMESENLYLGYGWYIRTNNAGEIRQYSHSGSDGVFFSYLLIRPLQNLMLYFVGSNGEEEVLPILRSILVELPD
ncbi:MAG: serine hydrolase [Pseudomonadales bacterium]|nr:serine hydrolase [Pseudomonadales bacterium]